MWVFKFNISSSPESDNSFRIIPPANYFFFFSSAAAAASVGNKVFRNDWDFIIFMAEIIRFPSPLFLLRTHLHRWWATE